MPRSDFDTAWKECIEALFPEAIAFFFAEIHREIDWSAGYVLLPNELRAAVRRAKKGTHPQ